MSDERACQAAEKRMEEEFGRLSVLAQKTSHNTRMNYTLRAEGVAMALTFLREEMRAAEGRCDGGLIEEIRRAERRSGKVPPHARPVYLPKSRDSVGTDQEAEPR